MLTDTADLVFARRLQKIYNQGLPVGPRGMNTMELLDESLKLDSAANIVANPTRALNYKFMVAEWLWMAMGRSDVASITKFNEVLRQFSDDGMFFAGAYGPHICAFRPRVLDKLRSDPDTRQAVIEIPRPQGPTKDEPCTLSMQFVNRHGFLHTIITMRSSDAWLGLPYDLFNFTMVQNSLAGELGLQRGWLSLHMGSSHIYERDLDKIRPLLQSWSGARSVKSPALPGWPPGWFDDVFEHGPLAKIPADAAPIWKIYAQILTDKRDNALGILRSLEA